MQKQEIPPVTPCHSGCDLALNQLVPLQAISRPPWRRYECSFNSRGPLWTPLHSPYLMGGRCRRSRRVGRVISRCGNQRAAGVTMLCFQCCEVSCVIHKGFSSAWAGRARSIRWPVYSSHTESSVMCSFLVLIQRQYLYKTIEHRRNVIQDHS